VPLPKAPPSQLLSLLSLLLLLPLLLRRSLTRSPPRYRGWRRDPSLAVRSRFRSFAGNPRGRRSHGYCRIRQGEATAPSRAHPRSLPACPRRRLHQRTLSCLRRDARPTAENVNILSRAAPVMRPLLATTHPPPSLRDVPRRCAPLYAPSRMPLPSLSPPANPFSQLHHDPSFSPFSFVVVPRGDSVSLPVSLSLSFSLSLARVAKTIPYRLRGETTIARTLKLLL